MTELIFSLFSPRVLPSSGNEKRGLKERKNRHCFLFGFSLRPLVFTRFRPPFLAIFRFKNKRGKGRPEERIYFFLFPFLLLVRKRNRKYRILPLFLPHPLFQKRRKKMGRGKLFHFLFPFFFRKW